MKLNTGIIATLALLLVTCTTAAEALSFDANDFKFIAANYCPSQETKLLPWKDVTTLSNVASGADCANRCKNWSPPPTEKEVNNYAPVLIKDVIQTTNYRCQFAFYSIRGDRKCHLYILHEVETVATFKKLFFWLPTITTKKFTYEPPTGANMPCRHSAQGSFYVKEYIVDLQIGSVVSVGGLSDTLKNALNSQKSKFDNTRGTNTVLVHPTTVRHCDSSTDNSGSSSCLSDCGYQVQKRQADGKCGKWKWGVKVDWTTSMSVQPDDSPFKSITSREAYRELVYPAIKKWIEEETKSRSNTLKLGCNSSCNQCGGRKVCGIRNCATCCTCNGRTGRSMNQQTTFKSQRVPQHMNYNIWRFKSIKANGEAFLPVVQFAYHFNVEGPPQFAQTPLGPTVCGTGTNFAGIGLGVASFVPVVGPLFGVAGLALAIGCTVEGESKGDLLPAPTKVDCALCDTVVADAKDEYLNLTAPFELPWYDETQVGQPEDVNASAILPNYHYHVQACERYCWAPKQWNKTVTDMRPLLDAKTCAYHIETTSNLSNDAIGPAVQAEMECKAQLEEANAPDQGGDLGGDNDDDEDASKADAGGSMAMIGVACGVGGVAVGVLAGVVMCRRREQQQPRPGVGVVGVHAVLGGDLDDASKREAAPSF
jgi:hypothetical protein